MTSFKFRFIDVKISNTFNLFSYSLIDIKGIKKTLFGRTYDTKNGVETSFIRPTNWQCHTIAADVNKNLLSLMYAIKIYCFCFFLFVFFFFFFGGGGGFFTLT